MNTFEERLVEVLENKYSVPFVDNDGTKRYVGLLIKNGVRLKIILSIPNRHRVYLYAYNDKEEVSSKVIEDLDYVIDFLNRAERFLEAK